MLQSCLNSQKKQIHLAGKSVFGWNQSVFKRVCFPFLFKKWVQSCVVVHIHPLSQCPCLFISLFLPAERRQSSGLKKTQSVTASRDSAVFLPLCRPFPPTSLSPLLGLQQDLMWLLSSQPLFYRWPWPRRFSSCRPPLGLCHVQLHFSPDICRYANMNSWLISAHIKVLFPYGPRLH